MLLCLAISAILLLLLYVFPLVRSFQRNDFKRMESSQNISGGFYKIAKDHISVSRIDDTNIYCTAENYILNKRTGEIARSLPLRFSNALELASAWIVKIPDHLYMQPLVDCILENKLTGDSVIITIDNFETTPNLRAFKNNSDTTLLIIVNSNFKKSDYCELGYIYAWPKK